MRIAALAGGSGFGALQRAAPPHGTSALLASGPRRILAARYVKLRWAVLI
jgi:hypothetical protein